MSCPIGRCKASSLSVVELFEEPHLVMPDICLLNLRECVSIGLSGLCEALLDRDVAITFD
jgi:hypothetical protein